MGLLLNKQHPHKELRDHPTSLQLIRRLWLFKSATQRLSLCVGRVWHAGLLASTTNRRNPANAFLGVQLDRRRSTFDHAWVVHDTNLDDSRIAEGLALSPEGRTAVATEASLGQRVCSK